jgi:hypothetical protein
MLLAVQVLPFYSLNNLPSLNSINNTGLFMLTYLERFVDAAPAGLTMADVQAADRDEELAGADNRLQYLCRLCKRACQPNPAIHLLITDHHVLI